MIGTWSNHSVPIPDGTTYVTGIEKTNPWWRVEGHWFNEDQQECVVGAGLGEKRKGLRIGDEIDLNVDDPSNNGPALLARLKSPAFFNGWPGRRGGGRAAVRCPRSWLDCPGMYRRLYVSALTKPEDAFARKDPKIDDAGGIRHVVLHAVHFRDCIADQRGVERARMCG